LNHYKGQKIEEQTEVLLHDKIDYEIERDNLIAEVQDTSFYVDRMEVIEKLSIYKIEAVEKVIKFLDDQEQLSDQLKEVCNEYFNHISEESINNFLLSPYFLSIKKRTLNYIVSILNRKDWFDYDVIFTLLRSDIVKAHTRVLYLLKLQKPNYSLTDIPKLMQLIELLSIYNNYPILQKTRSVFGKEKEEWECLNCGTKNEKDVKVCINNYCSANIYGIPENQVNPEGLIKRFTKRATKIQELLNTQNIKYNMEET